MNKQQKEYLVNKLTAAAGAAKVEFAKDKIVRHDEKDSIAALEAAGFQYLTPYSMYSKHAHGWSLPLTKEMEDNKLAIEKFNAKVQAELTKATDIVYLGSDEAALAILESFTNALKELN